MTNSTVPPWVKSAVTRCLAHVNEAIKIPPPPGTLTRLFTEEIMRGLQSAQASAPAPIVRAAPAAPQKAVVSDAVGNKAVTAADIHAALAEGSVRLGSLAVSLGATPEALRTTIDSPGSGLIIARAGWVQKVVE